VFERVEKSSLHATSRLRALSEGSFDLVLELAPDLTVRYACPQAFGHLGLTPEAVTGTSFLDYVAPEERDTVRAWSERAFFETPPEALRTRLRRADGSTVPYECALRIFVEAGESGAMLIANDRSALVDSEQRYRMLFERARNGLMLIGEDDKLLSCNEAMAAMLGYSVDEYLRIPREERIHPDDLPQLLEDVAHVVAGRSATERHIVRMLHRDGHTVVIDTLRSLIRLDGGQRVMLIEARDVTEETETIQALEQSEQRYRDLFELVQHGLLLTDRTGTMVLANQAMCDMLGYTRRDLLALDRLAIMHPDCRPAVTAYRERVSAGDFSIDRNEARLIRRDGTLMDALVVVAPLMVDGEYAGSLAAYTDVSETRRMERELHQVRDRVQRAEIRGEFLAMVSHELRTPLTAVLGFTELLQLETDGALSERQREYLNDIQIAAEHLLALIRDLLDLTRMEAGKFEVYPLPMSPATVADEAARIFGPLADGKSITLTIDAARAPHEMIADPRALRQVLNNLISNAVKFTHSGGVRVDIREEDGYCILEVADSGVGIPADTVNRVFDPFVQADMGLDRSYGGSGLGLPICQHLVDLHGGRIELSSALGQGTTVRVALPLAGPPEAQSPVSA
jgi:PAS domain S-box-containing protein